MSGFPSVGHRSSDYGSTMEEGKRAAPAAEVNPYFGAYLFTVALFLCFSAPIVLAIQLGMDPDVGFWIGGYALAAVLLPVLFILQYFLHIWLLSIGNPKKLVLHWTVIWTAVTLCVLGGSYSSKSRYLYGQLKSEDCSGAGGLMDKHLLQEAYISASQMHEDCSKRLFIENGNIPLSRRPVLQTCEEWVNSSQVGFGWEDKVEEVLVGPFFIFVGIFGHQDHARGQKRPGRLYQYLASTQANHACGGFCTSGTMLWSSADDKGSACSPIVGLKFVTVQHEAEVLFWSSAAAGILGLACLFAVRGRLERMGYS